MCVKVLLAEDAEAVRKAFRILLSEREDITLVGEAATLSEAIQKTERKTASIRWCKAASNIFCK